MYSIGWQGGAVNGAAAAVDGADMVEVEGAGVVEYPLIFVAGDAAGEPYWL